MQLGASLNTHLRKQILPRLDVAFTQRGTAEQSDVTLHLTDTVKSIRAGLAGTLNPATGSGTHQLTVHIDDLPYFTATITPLLQHFDLLKDSVTIRSGTVELTTTLTSKDFAVENWQQQSRLSANNVSGNVNDHAFDGLALAANWSGMTQWQTLQPLTMSVTTLNPGFAVKDFQLQLSLPKATPIAQPRVRIDAFSARVFGGQLTLPDAQAWDFAAPSNQVTLTAQSWQLGELVALQQNANIQAEGTLEGELPITVAGGRMIDLIRGESCLPARDATG